MRVYFMKFVCERLEHMIAIIDNRNVPLAKGAGRSSSRVGGPTRNGDEKPRSIEVKF